MSGGQNGREASRRRFIGGAGLLAAAAIAPLAAATGRNGQPAITPQLSRIIALHDRARAASDHHYREVEKPADDAWRAAIANYPAELPPPHEQSTTSFINSEGEIRHLSTESAWLAGTARRVVNDPTWADMGDEEWRQAHREIAEAFDRRDAVLAAQTVRQKAFEAETRQRLGLDGINARGDALDDRRYRLWQAAIAIPAASLADVVAKLDFARRIEGEDEAHIDVFTAIVADVRRLAEGEA